MRKLLILFVLVLVASGVYAQSDSSYSLNKDIRKTITTKDSVKNQVLDITYCWNSSSNSWENYRKKETVYNDNITVDVNSQWNSATKNWINTRKRDHFYAAKGKKETGSITYRWDTTNTWQKISKTNFFYDEKDLDTLYLIYHWNDDKKIWENSSKHQSTYDANRKKILGANYQWNKSINDWIKEKKTETIRDKKGKIVTFTYYVGDTVSNIWKNSYKTERTYDRKGNEKFKQWYHWNNDNDWDLTTEERTKFWYDSRDSITKIFCQCRKPKTSKTWINYSEKESIYDKKGRNIYDMSSKEWNDFVDAWIPENINAIYNKTFLEKPFLLVYPSIGMQSSATTFYVVDIPNSTNGEWKYAVNNKWKYKGNSKRVYESFSPKETGKTLKIKNLSDVFIIYECDYKGKHYTSNPIIIK